MAEPTSSQPHTPATIQADLQELAASLRAADHLEPDVQRALADLVAELGRDLDPGTLPLGEKAHLAETTALLLQALHQRHDAGRLAKVKERFEGAAARAEATAPFLTGMVRRLLDALSNLGI
jgi:hypothetical protein